MRFISVAPLAAAALATAGASGGTAFADQGMRISGPHSHANLAIYFVHGVSAGGAVPLTLQEALDQGKVQVVETGRVNELQIENTGAEQVFIQAGDIVKGGKQDRILAVSIIIPARSGRVSIQAFCVESGRWTKRGEEDSGKFNSSNDRIVTKELKLAANSTRSQQEVWSQVSEAQTRLSRNVGGSARGGGSDHHCGWVHGPCSRACANCSAKLGNR